MKKPSLVTGVPAALTAAGLAVFVLAVALAADPDPDDSQQGVAVTVEIEEAVVVPGIFRGPRDLAAEMSEGDFHFREVVDRIVLMEPEVLWKVENDSDGQLGLAISVLREDGSWAPGQFRGPQALARVYSEQWAEGQGLAPPPSSVPPVLPEGPTRARVIAPGTYVRVGEPGSR